jgi:hypothetical protein
VAPRVCVVGFDHVAEQHGGAPIRRRELERVVDRALPLARERCEEREGREHEQQCPRAPVGHEGNEQTEWCQQRIAGEGRED